MFLNLSYLVFVIPIYEFFLFILYYIYIYIYYAIKSVEY